MMKNTQTNYGRVARFFHWGIAALMIGLIGVGWIMTDLDNSPLKFQIYGLHKAFGITVLFLGAARLLWRLYNPPPQELGGHKQWEKILAKIIHSFFYASIIAMPLTGWALSSSAGYPVSWFGLVELPELVSENKAMVDFYRDTHQILGRIIAACIALHIVGALKHHFKDRDATLTRMAPFFRQR